MTVEARNLTGRYLVATTAAVATTTNPAALAESVASDSARDLQRATWALAWPVIFSFSIESFVGLCDMLMVGRLGPQAVAGVGVGVQILGAVDSLMFAVGTGTLAIVARQVGARDLRGAEETLGQSILAAMALSLLAVVPVRVWAPALVAAFRVQAEVVPSLAASRSFTGTKSTRSARCSWWSRACAARATCARRSWSAAWSAS